MSGDCGHGWGYTDTKTRQCVLCGPRQAHVIQCNDMVVCVVLGSESEATERMATEREAYYLTNKGNWVTWCTTNTKDRDARDREAYRQRCYWRINTVPLY